MGKLRILCFVFILVISVIPVFSDKCSTGLNDPVDITFLYSTKQPSVTWNKNNGFLTFLQYSGCLATPALTDYGVTCADNGGKYTLSVLHPQEGDVFDTNPSGGAAVTIIYQEPASLTVDITSPITKDTVLPSTDTIRMEYQISSCTKPQPNITWQYTTDGGNTRTSISNTHIQSTLDETGCTGTSKTKIHSKVDISKDSVPIIDVPFKVVCVLSYDVCTDNKYEKITAYTITITVKCIVVIMAIVGIVVMVFGELIVITGIFVCYYYNKKKEIGSWTGKICGIIITGLILIIIGIALFFSFNESKGTFGACAVEIVFIILIIIGIILLIICIVVLCLFNKKKDSQDQPDPPPAVPGQPLNITFLPAEADQICLTWTASGNGGDKQKFIVQHSTDGKTWTDSTPISDNSYCIKNLRPDTEYSIQVKAGNVAGYGKPQKVNRIKTKKIDSSSTAVGKRRREDPENGVELTDRATTPLLLGKQDVEKADETKKNYDTTKQRATNQ